MARKVSTLQRVPLAPVIGAMFGTAAAVLVAATPAWLFEQAMVSLGLATPPLGTGERLLVLVVAFALVGLAVWGLVKAAERVFAEPVARGADADELDLAGFADMIAVMPPRRPIFADRELGAPLMSDEALQTVAPMPEEAVELEGATGSIDVVPPVLELVEPPQRATGYTSIEELIRRLEIGMARRGGPRPPDPAGPAAKPSPAPGGSWIVREDEAGDSEASPTMQRMAAG